MGHSRSKLALTYVLIWPVVQIYYLLGRLRRFLFAKGVFLSHRLPGKVVSVGNITFGGTGKTPVVISLAQALKKKGLRPVILTRGYRSGLGANDAVVFLGDSCSPLIYKGSVGEVRADEARMQAELLEDVPVICGAQRVKAARSYLVRHDTPDIWLLDDGFQHLSLRRDLDILLCDASQPWGAGNSLADRVLRESPDQIKNAHHVLLTRYDANTVHKGFVAELEAKSIPFSFVPIINKALKQVSGSEKSWKRPLLVCGIARPEKLVASWPDSLPDLVGVLEVADHSPIPRSGVSQKMADVDADAVITTEKDYWRDPSVFHGWGGVPILTLPVEAELDLADELLKSI